MTEIPQQPAARGRSPVPESQSKIASPGALPSVRPAEASSIVPTRPPNARPDVLILLHDLRGGGAERAMLRLAGGMAAAGRRVHLLLVSAEGDYLSEIPKNVTMGHLGGGSVFGAIPAIARVLRALEPRTFLAALTHVNVAAVAAASLAGFKGRLVVSERNQFSAKSAAAKSWREKLTYALAPFAYARTHGVVAVSDGVARDLVEFARLPPSLVHYVHNPVYDEGLVLRGQEPAPHPWLDDGKSPVIIGVGRLHEQKDFATLLAAFFELRRARPARLIIFGEGPERGRLEELVSASPYAKDVALPGFCANPFAAMSRAAMLVLSSRWEGFPNVLVEAMSCGAPVVATDCPSGPHEILAGGQYGPLATVGDAPSLTRAMLAVLDNPSLGAIAAERAKIFSVKSAAQSYLDILGAHAPSGQVNGDGRPVGSKLPIGQTNVHGAQVPVIERLFEADDGVITPGPGEPEQVPAPTANEAIIVTGSAAEGVGPEIVDQSAGAPTGDQTVSQPPPRR